MSLSWRQLSGWAGVLYVVLFVAIGIMITDGPSITDSAADTRDWFANNETEVALYAWGMPLAFCIFFLLFASGLRSFLAPADPPNAGLWSRLSFAGALIQAAVALVGLSFWAVLTQEDILAITSDETLQLLNGFDTMIFFSILNWPAAMFLIGASVVIIQSGIMAKWIGWLGCLLALLAVISSLWIFSGDDEGFLGGDVGTVSFLGFQVWALVVAIEMIRSRDIDTTAVGSRA